MPLVLTDVQSVVWLSPESPRGMMRVLDEQTRAFVISRDICCRDAMPPPVYLSRSEGGAGRREDRRSFRGLCQGSRPWRRRLPRTRRRQCKRGGWSVERHLPPRCRIEGGENAGCEYSCRCCGAVGHEAVALLELRLAREVLMSEATVVRAIAELRKRADVRAAQDRWVCRSRRPLMRG